MKNIFRRVALALAGFSLTAGAAVVAAPAASAANMTQCINSVRYIGTGANGTYAVIYGASKYIDYNWWEELWGAKDGWTFEAGIRCA